MKEGFLRRAKELATAAQQEKLLQQQIQVKINGERASLAFRNNN